MLYKVYSYNGTYKTSLSGDAIYSNFSYSAQVNGGQGSATVISSFDWAYDGIVYGDIIKVESKGVLIYSGFVNKIKRTFGKDLSNIEYNLVGISSLFTQVLYSSASLYSFTKNTEPKTIIQEIMDVVNTDYNLFTLDCATYGSNVEIKFDNIDCMSAFNKVIAVTGWRWHIDCNGVIRCGGDVQFSVHSAKLQEDIEYIEVTDDGTNIINNIVLSVSDGSTTGLDAASISLYGKRQRYVSESSLVTGATANTWIGTYFDENAEPKSKTTMVFNKLSDIGNQIRPGDIINISNSPYNLANLGVVSVKWSPEKVTVEIKTLENYTMLLKS